MNHSKMAIVSSMFFVTMWALVMSENGWMPSEEPRAMGTRPLIDSDMRSLITSRVWGVPSFVKMLPWIIERILWDSGRLVCSTMNHT